MPEESSLRNLHRCPHRGSRDFAESSARWEYLRPNCVDRGFPDDKSSQFGLERFRMGEPERLERLPFILATAAFVLRSLATD